MDPGGIELDAMLAEPLLGPEEVGPAPRELLMIPRVLLLVPRVLLLVPDGRTFELAKAELLLN